MGGAHDEVSPWVRRFAGPLAGGTAVDVACGAGRHARWLADRGHRVLAVDRDGDALAALADVPGVTALQADLEAGAWPLAGRSAELVVVTNYLWRPHLRDVVALVADAGWLVWETFAVGQEQFGRPTNPDFLLRPGELLEAVRPALQVVAYEHGRIAAPRPAVVQRIAAFRGDAAALPIR